MELGGAFTGEGETAKQLSGIKFTSMETSIARLLLVEDDPTLGYLLREFLTSRNYTVDLATDGAEALRMFKQGDYDLCIFDVMLPALDGFTVVELIKERRPALPVIFLTAKSLHADVVRGYQAGADDYIKKPVDEEELLKRIEAVLKRSARGHFAGERGERAVYQLGHYRFWVEKRLLQHPDADRTLTEKEAALLTLFCSASGEVVPREYALQQLWGRNDYLARKSMDVFIARLRKYLSKDPEIQLANIRDSGFVLQLPPPT